MKPLQESTLAINCLGTLSIVCEGEELGGVLLNKAQALLVYLALEPEPHERASLAALLWSDMPDRQARANLRTALSRLRRPLAPYLDVTRRTLAFAGASAARVDVALFIRGLQGETPAEWRPALALYRGDFLAGFAVREAPLFEEWQLLKREQLRALALDGLFRLAQTALDTGDPQQAVSDLRHLLRLDPWREAAHRTLMHALLAAGDRAAALAQFESCRQALADDLGVAPSPATVALYQSIRQGPLPAVMPGPASSPALPAPVSHNLPAPSTPLIGREAEAAQLEALLTGPACRLLTIVGPGGIGKTRLALAVASALRSHFPHGVFVVPLAATTPQPNNNPLAPAIAAALGFTFSGPAPPEEQLVNHLCARRLLLLLDNVEHLLPHTAWLSDLLARAPDVRLLVTSRETLQLYEECLFDLPGLPVPAVEDIPSTPAAVEQLLRFPGVQLFVQRARRVYLRFDPAAPAEAAAIATICRLLEGVPLALELAAAWVRTLSCAEIATAIAANLDFLTARSRNRPDRHQSLRAVFHHSWALLTESEQQALAQVAVFSGGFTAEAAQQVAGAGLPLLARLVDKSLLQRQSDGRYAMHALLRHFAAEQNSDATLSRRHATYYAHWLEQQEKGLDCGEPQVVQQVAQELANLLAAWQWAVAAEEPALVTSALHGLSSYWELRGLFREGDRLLQQALHAFTSPYLRALLQARRGRFNYILGNNPLAQQLLRESLEALPAGTYPAERALALTNLALALNALGQSAEAERHARESLALLTRLGDLDGQASANNNLAFVLTTRGRHDEARRHLQTSLAQYSALGNRRGRVKPLNLLGSVFNAQGAYQEARQHYEQGLSIAQALEDRWLQASFLVNLCVLAKKQGEFEQAARVGEQSLALFSDLGEQRGTAVALKNLGDVACARRAWAPAKQYYEASLAIRRTIGDRFGEALDQYALAAWATAQGQNELAWSYLRPAYRQAGELQATALQLYMLPTLARLLLAQGNVTQAAALAHLALSHAAAEASVRDQARQLLAQMDNPLPPSPLPSLSDIEQHLHGADERPPA